jgi:hypothetical protein
MKSQEVFKEKQTVNKIAKHIYLLGKSTKDGNRGRNDPGDIINPGKIFINDFSNLQDKQIITISRLPLLHPVNALKEIPP